MKKRVQSELGLESAYFWQILFYQDTCLERMNIKEYYDLFRLIFANQNRDLSVLIFG